MSAFESSKDFVFAVKDVSKIFFVPNLDHCGEIFESLNDVSRVGLQSFEDDFIERGIVEPHGFEPKGSVVEIGRWAVDVNEDGVVVVDTQFYNLHLTNRQIFRFVVQNKS